MIDCLNNNQIKEIFKNKAFSVAKKLATLGSNKTDENSVVIDNKLVTYVKNSNGEIIEETRNELSDDVVIARNVDSIGIIDGIDIYNEWLVPKDTWMKNYGIEVTDTFKPYKKTLTIKVIEIDNEILNILNSKDGCTAQIAVDWTDDGMTVYKGGVITENGFGIAPEEFKTTYEESNQ